MSTVALVGVGRWGRRLLRVLDRRAHVVACCARDRETLARWLASHYPHIPATAGYEDILGDRSVEAVVLATPIATHADLARKALEAGKHVFVEKPLATEVGASEALLRTAVERERLLFVGHVYLHHPAFARLRERAAAEGVAHARTHWTKFGTFEEPLLWNLLSHDVALALALFAARPDRAQLLHASGSRTALDRALVRLHFAAGTCLLEVDRYSPISRKTVTVVTRAGRQLVWEDDVLRVAGPSGEVEEEFVAGEEPLDREIASFLQALRRRPPPLDEARLAAAVVGVLAALEKGAETHAEVRT